MPININPFYHITEDSKIMKKRYPTELMELEFNNKGQPEWENISK